MRLIVFLPLMTALIGCVGARNERADDSSSYRLISPPTAVDSIATARAVTGIERLPGDVFTADTFRAENDVTLRYRLLPPLDPEPGIRYPLVVIFHGAGEIGTDNEKHLDRFPKAWARPAIRARYPTYVLAPQMPERSAVYNGPADTPGRRSEAAPPLHAALDLIDHLRGVLSIDTARIYALGFSMGASTTWNAIGLRPDLFAAAIPIAGVPNPALAAEVARTPVWIVHGNADDTNPIEQDREMFALLRQHPEARVRFWEFDGLWHAVPPSLLAGDEFAAWLFAHRR